MPEPVAIRTGERVRALPALREFVEAAMPHAEAADPETFWNCEAAFARLLDGTFFRDLVRYELGRIAGEPAYVPTAGVSSYSFTIIPGGAFSLAAEIFEPGLTFSRKLYSLTDHCLAAIVPFPGCGGVTYEWFEQRDPWPNEVLDRTRRLGEAHRRTFVAGEIIRFRAGIDVARMVPPEQSVAMLFLVSKPVVPLRWEYGENGYPLRAMAGVQTCSRLDYSARLLGEFGFPSSIAPLRKLAGHPQHYVRWAAVRAVMRIDFDEGLELLRRAREDAHPHVRRAAQSALDKLVADERLREPAASGAAV